jgi:hypothetical protein
MRLSLSASVKRKQRQGYNSRLLSGGAVNPAHSIRRVVMRSYLLRNTDRFMNFWFRASYVMAVIGAIGAIFIVITALSRMP